jgi:hypothetical protein
LLAASSVAFDPNGRFIGECHNQSVSTTTDILGLVAMVALMVLVVMFASCHLRQIRHGRMDPLVGLETTRPPSATVGDPLGQRCVTLADPFRAQGKAAEAGYGPDDVSWRCRRGS